MEAKKIQEKKPIGDLTFKAELKIGPFKIKKEVGSGRFGSVFSGIHEQTKEKVAIKQIKKSEITNENLLTSEINIHKILFHPNICRMYCVIEDDTYIFLINEFCSNGDILQKIIEEGAFDENKSCKIFQQIICGLEYLHKNFICHRDIKPENILLANIDNDDLNVKISDFGLSKSFAGNKLLKTPCGSPAYAAPEVLKGKEYKGNKIDIWGTGIVLYTMVYGALPFDQENIKDLVYNITKGNYSLPDTVSKNCQDLISKILQVDPNKRINIHEIKNHPWMKQFNIDLMKSPGLFINEDILPIDTQIIKEMSGKNKKKIHEYIDDIIKNRHNSNTVSYYLRVNQKVNRGESSISDFSSNSELFLNYIENETSKKKYWNGDLDSRIKILEEEIYRSFIKEKRSKESRNKILTSANLELDSNIESEMSNNSINLNKTVNFLNVQKFQSSKKESIKNTKSVKFKKIKNDKNKKIVRSYSQTSLDNSEQEPYESINKVSLFNVVHHKNDKFIKNIDIEEVKNDNQTNENQKEINLRKKYIKQFVPKNIINNEEKKENNNYDINPINKIIQFIKRQLTFSKDEQNDNKDNKNNNNNLKEKLFKETKNDIMKLNKEESKQQIIQKKQILRIKLPVNEEKTNLEKKRKIITNHKYKKNEEEKNKNKNNDILHLFNLNNFFLNENINHKLNSSKEESIPFNKHKKIKKLLPNNEIDIKQKEEIKENKTEKISFNFKDEEIETINTKYSFQTESTISKIEIILKSLVNECNIVNKNDNEIIYNCQKFDEKGEKFIFNLQIIKINDECNSIKCKYINGNKNSFDEIFNMIKNILNINDNND